MAQAPIISPTAATTNQPWLAERAGIAESSSGAFVAGQFVTTSGSGVSSVLAAVGNATSLVYGLAQRSAAGTGAEPYTSPTATTHNPVDVLNGQFWVNSMGSGAASGTGSATALVAGSRYDIRAFTTSGYSGIQGLDASSTASSGFFRYEGIVHPDDAVGDTNARVLVTVQATRQ